MADETNAGKYSVPGDEHEILPNLLGLKTKEGIDEAEFIGFLEAQESIIDGLDESTVFDLKFLYSIHREAFKNLYAFAGQLRTVNMSKGGFTFPAARFLPQSLEECNQEMLRPLNQAFPDRSALVTALSKAHAELLFIHPFREGNGRTIRMFTNMVFLYHTGEEINFAAILKENMDEYIAAVQAAAGKNYEPMIDLFTRCL